MKHSKNIWERPGFLIRRLQQIQVAIFLEENTEVGITPVQWGIMTIVHDSPGISHIEISEQLGLDRSNIANVVNRLVKKGILNQKVSRRDRRRKEISMTQKGEDLMNVIEAGARRFQKKLLMPLSEEEQEIFVELLTRIVYENNHLGRAQLKLT